MLEIVISTLLGLLILPHRVTCLSSTPPQQFAVTRNVATQVLQGTGPPEIDLNVYNLKSLEEIEKEWTANFVQKSTESVIDGGVYLAVKSDRELYVDTISVLFERLRDSPGLGIELSEIAGGRDDGLGITLVTGLVQGGSADSGSAADGRQIDIRPGDVLSKVAIVRARTSNQNMSSSDDSNIDVDNLPLMETQEEFSVRTECLSYDATVQALQALPRPNTNSQSSQEYYKLQIKRIRRKPKVKINLRYPPSQNQPDESIQLYAGENLRQGMLVRGVKLNDPLVKRFDTKNGGNCGAGGLCRTCAVSVLRGKEMLNPQRVAEEQMLAGSEGSGRWRLACKAIVGYGMREGEITLEVNPRQWES